MFIDLKHRIYARNSAGTHMWLWLIHGDVQQRPAQYCKAITLQYVCVCVCVCVLVTQLCPTLCNSMDCSSPDSSVHRILQARKLEWVAISFSRGSSPPRDWTLASCIAVILYCLSHQGNLYLNYHLQIILPQGSANFVSRHQIPTLRFFLFSICCIARMPRRVSGA